jgi:DNA-binding NtrC family response regulator
MRVHIHPPDGGKAAEVELSAGERLLVGRDPDPGAKEAELQAPVRTRRLPVSSSLVSSNHLVLWSDGESLHARDLHSKNGTYLRLERGSIVSLPDVHEAHFYLAAPRPAARAAAPREVAVVDADAEVFAGRLKDAIAEWLAHSGLFPTLRVVLADSRKGGEARPSLAPLDDSRFTIPVGEGLELEVADQDLGRTQLRWDSIKAELFPYVYDQIGRWRACRSTRARGPLLFTSPAAARALREVLDAARAGLPLVLRGESGTGKTALAAIYAGRESLRAGGSGAISGSAGGPPFMTVHCAHLEPHLAHSVLFGALKGSYTSCERTIVGAVKLADGGVLFLDDVDGLPLETQGKLLRFLDEGQYEPLGHGRREPLVANVRVIAGTNADLRAAVRERCFREDLYWRLHMGAVVRLPPLRERPEDIEQLLRDSPGTGPLEVDSQREAARGSRGAPGRSVRERIDAAAVEYLVHRHPWRGNFRECLRFCARVRMEPAARPILDRRRCEEILAEASLDPEPPAAAPADKPLREVGGSTFERALAQALQWWDAAEGGAPERFDELGRFCESYLKSSFVAHALGLADAEERPESFDRERRQQLGCDLTTLKRKMDDYLAVKQGQGQGQGQPRNHPDGGRR